MSWLWARISKGNVDPVHEALDEFIVKASYMDQSTNIEKRIAWSGIIMNE